MKDSHIFKEVEKDLLFCKDYWTILYGSFITQDLIPNRSDIDVAVITKSKNKDKNLQIWKSLLGKAPATYDIRIFELLPLYIKIDVIQNYKTLFGDPLEISEYFYFYRKLWKEMIPRIKANQFESIEEKFKLMENRKQFL